MSGRLRQDATTAPAPSLEELNRFGRTPPEPAGVVFVRDPNEDRARALREHVKRFEDVGEEVPEHLAELVSKLKAGEGKLPEPVSEEPTPEPEVEDEPATDSTPDAVVAEEVVVEEEPAEAEESWEDFTVAELKAELDRLEIDYDPKAHKADLIALLEEAEGAE